MIIMLNMSRGGGGGYRSTEGGGGVADLQEGVLTLWASVGMLGNLMTPLFNLLTPIYIGNLYLDPSFQFKKNIFFGPFLP